MIESILVGSTGFVGSNLLCQRSFDEVYSSRNITELSGRECSVLIWSGVKAEKWRANSNPEEDQAHIAEVISRFKTVRAERAILISTVDVYPVPRLVDEDTQIDPAINQPYGANRRTLEIEFGKHFGSRALIVRLPALFGTGLKKNALFDLLNEKVIHPKILVSTFQFYDLNWLWKDLEVCMKEDLKVVNFATSPLSMRELIQNCFPERNFQTPSEVEIEGSIYDFRTRFGSGWGRSDGYIYSKSTVLENLIQFVQTYTSAPGVIR